MKRFSYVLAALTLICIIARAVGITIPRGKN